jgi:glutathione S-transferase
MDHYRILGGLGSPYSMKMRAILRYRRLPHLWIQVNETHEAERAHVRPAVIPVIQYPDGTYHNDSTPMIYDLEARHPERSIVPTDPGDAFLAYLLEDMADEWGTKIMFHYRWHRERDQKQMSEWLAYDRSPAGGLSDVKRFAAFFRDRQVGRMALVGCTPANAPILDDALVRLAGLFEAHVTNKPDFLFGSRPSLAEFGWYGQFSQLIVDPTANDTMRDIAPFTTRWIMHMDDLSGVDGDWRAADAPLPPIVRQLLAFAGEVYLPFLEANVAALAAGEETFTVDVFGRPYSQGAFKYQARCLESLRRAYADLPEAAKARIDPMLQEAGVLAPLTRSA